MAQDKPITTHHKLRFVTATSLFDGHDVAINIMRRILQSSGAEVIHLGHNRSVHEIVTTAIQEDVHAIAISSYQGGHIEYFKYIIDQLRLFNASHIKVFGGGGGVIIPDEISALQAYGVTRIYSPQDGQSLGLQGIINDMLAQADFDICATIPQKMAVDSYACLARLISCIENNKLPHNLQSDIAKHASMNKTPILGITGTGGAGKSSLTDELILRFRMDNPDIRIGIVAIDPARKKTGGALLGDRIRMNAIDSDKIYMRSLANRSHSGEIITHLSEIIQLYQIYPFDLIIIETPGIGQGDAGIVPFVDIPLYVMTPEFGATSQLEKIDMLDYAACVAINKFDRKGALDALRDVRKQMQRNKQAFATSPEKMPVYGTIASKFNDDGVTALYYGVLAALNQIKPDSFASRLPTPTSPVTSFIHPLIPGKAARYLAEIADTVRNYHRDAKQQATLLRQHSHLSETKKLLVNTDHQEINALLTALAQQIHPENLDIFTRWHALQQTFNAPEFYYQVRNRTVQLPLYTETLAGTKLPKIALPKFHDNGDRLLWLLKENVPGYFPFTAGVFPLKRQGEDPNRLFAGEGDAFKTNKRFKFLSAGMPATRLSTAFDSVTLYGFNPDERPDIYGKIGNSGVSIATLDDMKALFDGFDLCDPKTSVSMTINGPAPTLLAFFLNTAIDQQVDKKMLALKRGLTEEEYNEIKATVLHNVRGTVQADILKEDQAQNTCIFSTEFSLKMMVDVQAYFVEHRIKNFYSVSISGYHIAEAGANPISQLAFTLSNGFTFVEAYLARGMAIDDFAPNLSFFFSNGMCAEYTVMGRVARRIWAIAMRDRYGANINSQKLKYHVQTSGRSLHAQEMAFNDIRTTLEALIALYDNCNSLHTNAYDEAITTPTEESVRRALAIQLIINKEWGIFKNENINQGSFIIEELTDLVEEAVLIEFEKINDRGGVLGAMETGYQRSKIQEESMYYEGKKHDGSLPIVGVNTFMGSDSETKQTIELARSTEAEKHSQYQRLQAFHEKNQSQAEAALTALRNAVINNENVFSTLMETARYCSLGQISAVFFQIGGKYRRNM